MELNLSNRGLFSFDAAKAQQDLVKAASGPRPNSATTADATSLARAPAPASLPTIRLLNLSYNALHIFTGGETLRGLVVLDLSHNELTQLQGQSLPPTLLRLHLAHNRLVQLPPLAQCTPRLVELDVGHNALTSAALRGLPQTLTQLSVKYNAVESLKPLGTLIHLVKLNAAHNEVAEVAAAVQGLSALLSLRQLDLRGNPVCGDAQAHNRGSHDSSTASNNADLSSGVRQQALTRALNDAVPRLAVFNGRPLSQAPEHQRLRGSGASRRSAAEEQGGAGRTRSRSGPVDAAGRSASRDEDGSCTNSSAGGSAAVTRSHASRTRTAAATQQPMELRLMEAKVSELRRLLLAAQDAEGKARQRRALLAESVKSTALVIDQQGAELERLQGEMERLHAEEAELRGPMAAVEESFENVHASLLVAKAKASAEALK